MKIQFSNPEWLFLLVFALPWIFWLTWKSDVQLQPWRRWTAFGLRLVVMLSLVLAIAGLQWLKPMEGMNLFYLLDRSDSVPSIHQEMSRNYVNQTGAEKKPVDKGGVVVFGSEAGIETTPNVAVEISKIQAVVGTERTDIASAIRLATAAFPETGQKRLVLISDGNENIGEALGAASAARALGVTVDVVPVGAIRGQDVSVQKLALPSQVKKGQTFEVKIFAQTDRAQSSKVRLYRNDQFLGEQQVNLEQGKNLFSFPQTLTEPGFYSYEIQLEAPGDSLPQNNRARGFAHVRGDPRVLVISSVPSQDAELVAALRSSRLEVKAGGLEVFPGNLPEMQSYDTIFISNISAGDLGKDNMRLLESAVKDFGVGLVCVGGDQTYAAGGYRGTPLEAALPVDMELSSKKVLPSGALVLVMHGMEFPGGNQWARSLAVAALDALGPQDEMGVVLWDGTDKWLFPLAKVGDKKDMGRKLAGMNQGDLPSFQGLMEMSFNGDPSHKGLKHSTANLKHMIVFSDGDPGAPTRELMDQIVAAKITVSTVMIGGHTAPDTMARIADQGKGRFYDVNVNTPEVLPQIFIKETAVILKSAIFEEPFKPVMSASSEMLRGIGAAELPQLLGYVATTAKPRAEVPLVSDKRDPVLAHWQYGLGRAVAFTSDAKAKWARDWLGWQKYKQFWGQVAQWSLRRVENSDFTTEVSVDKGEGQISVEAVDPNGNYRNFLNLQTTVVSPKGTKEVVRLEQTGPGRYEGKFGTKEVGAYLMNLTEFKNGLPVGGQVLGASVNYSPEFNSSEPNHQFLTRLAELGGGKVLDPTKPREANPFLHDRKKTFQPRDLWEWLLKWGIVLFTLDVAVRRVQIDREEWWRATKTLQQALFFWRGVPRPASADESLGALLVRRDAVRTQTAAERPAAELFKPRHDSGTLPLSDPSASSQPKPANEPEVPTATSKAAQPTSTAGRLLEAKRKAQRRNDEG